MGAGAVKPHHPQLNFEQLIKLRQENNETPPINPDEWVETRGSENEQGWLKLSSPITNNAEDVVATAAG